MPFDKEEWYDYQEKKKQHAETLNNLRKIQLDYNTYSVLKNKIDNHQDLTPEEASEYERLVKEFTEDKFDQYRNIWDEIDRFAKNEQLQKEAPIYDDVYDIE